MLRIFKQNYPIRNVFFVIGEGLVIYVSVLLASWTITKTDPAGFNQWLWFKILLITFVCQVSLYYNDLYDLAVTDSFLKLGVRLLQSLGASSIFLAVVYIIFPGAIIRKSIFTLGIAFIILLIVSWRFGYKFVLEHELFNQKIILMGSGDLAENIINEISNKKDSGYSVSINVPECSGNTASASEKYTTSMICEQSCKSLCDLAEELNIDMIVVAMTEKRSALPVRELLNCRVKGIDVVEGTSFYEMLKGKLFVEQINPAWLIFSKGFQKSLIRRFLKRTLDIILSLALLILLSPVIIITAILIKMDSKGPVIFSQDRVGKNKKTYMVYKFRSMVADAEKKSGPVWAKDNDDRVTRVGRIIRKCRIDELPQLWNVLIGDMSFVGPRPEREFFVKELQSIIPYYELRFSVKPGISGWAQVCYGYGASVEDAVEKLNYDLFYIKNMSFFMDIMIVLRTIKIVLFGKGAR